MLSGDIANMAAAEIWVAEWSRMQGCFHVQRLAEACKANMRRAISRESTDFQVIGCFSSREKASEFIDLVREAQSRVDALRQEQREPLPC